MKFIHVLFISALLISGVAEFYAIAGLVSIFSSQPIAAIVMGVALGIGKLVAASWVYRNWSVAPKALIAYFTTAVVLLSFITSMGIFGYLSKAHIEQAAVIGDSQSKVSIYDEKIKIAQDNVDRARKTLKQLDEAVDQTMARSSNEKGANNAVYIRRTQQKERTRLTQEIESEQKKIIALREESAPLRADVRKIESEVGPIKYVAELVYGDSSEEVLGKAVRLLIILIIFVFDPLAILLIIAVNMEMKKNSQPWLEPMVMVDVPEVKREEPKKQRDKRRNIGSGEDV